MHAVRTASEPAVVIVSSNTLQALRLLGVHGAFLAPQEPVRLQARKAPPYGLAEQSCRCLLLPPAFPA